MSTQSVPAAQPAAMTEVVEVLWVAAAMMEAMQAAAVAMAAAIAAVVEVAMAGLDARW